MGSKFQIKDAVYDCPVIWPEQQKIYFGLAKRKRKQRYYKHKKSFTTNDIHMGRHMGRYENKYLLKNFRVLAKVNWILTEGKTLIDSKSSNKLWVFFHIWYIYVYTCIDRDK